MCFWILFLPIFPLSFGILFPNYILGQLCASICPLLLLLLLQLLVCFFLPFLAFCLPISSIYPFVSSCQQFGCFSSFLSVIWSVFAILFQFVFFAMSLPGTLNIQTGRKLAGKSKDDILKAVLKFNPFMKFWAVQIAYDVIRVTFKKEEHCRLFKTNEGLHVFDYPYEASDDHVKTVLSDYGNVKSVRKEKYISQPEISTGTRLVSLVVEATPPRFLTINGYLCRLWYKGQPLICNLCSVQGHKSADCPNKDKCRKCGVSGHFARRCPNSSSAWGEVSPEQPFTS